jgi:two-component system, OmpR family, KDP operon response regulator KdpE
MVNVLVVQDDTRIASFIKRGLEADGFAVRTASDGADGLRLTESSDFDLIILDLLLPTLTGEELLTRLREKGSTVPVIVLTAKDAISDRVANLDAGADDYVTKPFGMDELLARLRAAVRRGVSGADEPILRTDDFTIDLAAKRVTRADRDDVRLTPTEWQLLEALARNRGRLVTQRQLLHDVWGPAYETESNYLRVYVAQLRRKLEPDPTRPRYLLTEPGMGYRFAD